MNIRQSDKSKDLDRGNKNQMQKNEVHALTEFWALKINQTHKRIQENKLRLKTMESHTDYKYKDLLRIKGY